MGKKNNRNLGTAARDIGRFVRDVAYVELVPKDAIKYEPASYLNDAARMMTSRMAVKYITFAALTKYMISQGLPPSLQLAIPTIYLAVDTTGGALLTLWNMYRGSEAPHSSPWYRDNLKSQPATLAIEVPYRTIKATVKVLTRAVKHFSR